MIEWKPANRYHLTSACGNYIIAKRICGGVPTYDCSRRVKDGAKARWEPVRDAAERIMVFESAQAAKDHLNCLEPF